MTFIQKNKLMIIVIICLFFIIILLFGIINKSEKNTKKMLTYMHVEIDEKELKKNIIINEDNSTKLAIWYTKNSKKEYVLWSQICLFFDCSNFIYEYALRKEDEDSRRERYKNNKINYDFLEKDKTISDAEKKCYLIYYKTQDNIDLNKKEFLNNYDKCKNYYYKHLPELKVYEKQFLDIFKF